MNYINSSTAQFNAYEYLKKLILTGELKIDTLYSETKMSKEAGVSRTPFREAIKKLSHEGFLEVVPSKGFMLRKLNEKDIRETIQVRCAIEGFCTHLICDNLETKKTKELLKLLDELLTKQEECIGTETDNKKLLEYDHAFHLAIIKFSDNSEFVSIFQNLMHLIRLITNQSLAIKGRPKDTISEHREFYNNLVAGNEAAAYKILVSHLNMPITIKIINN